MQFYYLGVVDRTTNIGINSERVTTLKSWVLYNFCVTASVTWFLVSNLLGKDSQSLNMNEYYW